MQSIDINWLYQIYNNNCYMYICITYIERVMFSHNVVLSEVVQHLFSRNHSSDFI